MLKEFHFTVTDLARFLGKSPVTLRGWERQGLIKFPRDGSDRKFSCDDVIRLTVETKRLGRVNQERVNLVVSAITILKIIEQNNGRRKKK